MTDRKSISQQLFQCIVRYRRKGQAAYIVAIASLLSGCGGGGASPDAETSPVPLVAPYPTQASRAKSLPSPVAVAAPKFNGMARMPEDSPPIVAKAESSTDGFVSPSIHRRVAVRGLESPSDIALGRDERIYYSLRFDGINSISEKGVKSEIVGLKDLDAADVKGGYQIVSITSALTPARNDSIYALLRRVEGKHYLNRIFRIALDRSGSAAQSWEVVYEFKSRHSGLTGSPSLRSLGKSQLMLNIADGENGRSGVLLRLDCREAELRNASSTCGVKGLYQSQDGPVLGTKYVEASDSLYVSDHSGLFHLREVSTQEGGQCALDEMVLSCDVRQMAAASPVWRSANSQDKLSAIDQLVGAGWKAWAGGFLLASANGTQLRMAKIDAGSLVRGPHEILKDVGGISFQAFLASPNSLSVLVVRDGGRLGEIWKVWPS